MEILRDELNVGLNQIDIIATDSLSNETVKTVTLGYVNTETWPIPYSFDWASVENLTDPVYVVDGKWVHDATGARPVEVGYDRLLCIGDITWTDYQVEVPVTIYGIDPAGFEPPNVAPAVGIMLRWQGHTDWGGAYPRIGWTRYGGIAWYDWRYDNVNGGFGLRGAFDGMDVQDLTGRTVTFGQTEIWKFEVGTVPGTGSQYRFKVWNQGDPEPEEWFLTGWEDTTDLANGSLLLIANFADVVFGDVTVRPGPNLIPPVITSIDEVTGLTTATVTWTTDEPTTGTFQYGETLSYELGTIDLPTFTLEHSVPLTGLTPDTRYEYLITATDEDGNTTDTASRTEIRAKVWEDGSEEPASWQIDAYDEGTDRLTDGRIGLWSLGTGTKAWDDLMITLNSPPPPTPVATATPGGLTPTPTPTSTVSVLLDEDFEGYAPGQDPLNWVDTGADNSMGVVDYFSVMDIDGQMAMGTTSTLTNIHSHYVTAESANWRNYTFTGRMRVTDPEDGIGVTFLSDYTNEDRYYRLRRHGTGYSTQFHLAPHGATITSGIVDTGLNPLVDVWYRFMIEASDGQRRTFRTLSTDPTETPVHVNTPTPSDTPTEVPTGTPTDTPTATTTDTVTPVPTNALTATATQTPVPTGTLTETPSSTPTNTSTPTVTFAPTDTPTKTPTVTFAPTDTPTVTSTPADTPTETQTPVLTPTPTKTPIGTPTSTPTDTPTPSLTTTPICSGFEADVAPRPDGSNACPSTVDWVQVGRFAVALDTASCPCEFQKADCAPRSSLGNGVISITDWVQSGRYAAGLELCTPVGGPVCPAEGKNLEASALVSDSTVPPDAKEIAGRAVRIVETAIERGQNGIVTVEFDSEGNENALGFSVSFDTSELTFVSAAKGSGADAAFMQVNSSAAGEGRIGLGLALGVMDSFPAGTHEIAVITFAAAAGTGEATIAVTFGDVPTLREISDPAANPLSAAYVNGQVTLPVSPALTPTVTEVPTPPYYGSTGVEKNRWRVYR